MKIQHFTHRSIPVCHIVIDDFGNEHNLITGDGDFGSCGGDTHSRAGAFAHSEMQEPEAFEALWGAQS